MACKKTLSWAVGHSRVHGLLGGVGNQVQHKIELSPDLGYSLEHRFQVTGHLNIAHHKDRGLHLFRKGFDVRFRLLSRERNSQVRTKDMNHLCATVCDTSLVGDAENQTFLACEKSAGQITFFHHHRLDSVLKRFRIESLLIGTILFRHYRPQILPSSDKATLKYSLRGDIVNLAHRFSVSVSSLVPASLPRFYH